MADWEEGVRVQFRRKRTFDAGATPGFGETDTPDLKPVDEGVAGALRGDRRGRRPAADRRRRRQSVHRRRGTPTTENTGPTGDDEPQATGRTGSSKAHRSHRRRPIGSGAGQAGRPGAAGVRRRPAESCWVRAAGRPRRVGRRPPDSQRAVAARPGKAADQGVRWLGRELRELGRAGARRPRRRRPTARGADGPVGRPREQWARRQRNPWRTGWSVSGRWSLFLRWPTRGHGRLRTES